MRPPHRLRALCVLLALAPITAGCIAVVAGGAAAIGYVYYRDNEAYQDYEVELEDAWDATIASLQRLNYPVSSSTPLGPTEGEIEVDDVLIRVETHPTFTRIRVRVGTFKTEDHQRRAAVILTEVDQRLEEN